MPRERKLLEGVVSPLPERKMRRLDAVPVAAAPGDEGEEGPEEAEGEEGEDEEGGEE